MSKYTLAEAKRRGESIANHGNAYASKIPGISHDNYYYNLTKSQANNNNQALDPSSVPAGSGYNYTRAKGQKTIAQIVNSDPLFLQAQSWGMRPGALNERCKEVGVNTVRASIALTSAIEARYFKQGFDVDQQRGAYCMAIIKNGGPNPADAIRSEIY